MLILPSHQVIHLAPCQWEIAHVLWIGRSGLKPSWWLTKLYWAVPVYWGMRVCGVLTAPGKNRDFSKYFVSSVIY